MPLWLDDFFLAIVLLSMVAFLLGILLFIFKAGKRKFGAKISGLSVIVLLISGYAFGVVNSSLLEKSGFESQTDYNEAASFGIDNAQEWDQRKEALQEERRLKEEAQGLEREAKRMAEKAKVEEALAAKKAKEEETRQKGFHCLSVWDGSHEAFKRHVKSMMRNPSSFEHVSTRVTPVSDAGTHTVLMEYRAENGFGGMNMGTAVGEYSSENCDDFSVLSVN